MLTYSCWFQWSLTCKKTYKAFTPATLWAPKSIYLTRIAWLSYKAPQTQNVLNRTPLQTWSFRCFPISEEHHHLPRSASKNLSHPWLLLFPLLKRSIKSAQFYLLNTEFIYLCLCYPSLTHHHLSNTTLMASSCTWLHSKPFSTHNCYRQNLK